MKSVHYFDVKEIFFERKIRNKEMHTTGSATEVILYRPYLSNFLLYHIDVNTKNNHLISYFHPKKFQDHLGNTC